MQEHQTHQNNVKHASGRSKTVIKGGGGSVLGGRGPSPHQVPGGQSP